MNTDMYQNKAVQRNISALRSDGYHILAPHSGELACGITGPGRLPDPESILDRLIKVLCPNDLMGLKILVTAGPTQEPMDPVRFVSNPSTGKMGYAIAKAAEHRGAEVTLISGPTNLPFPLNIKGIRTRTAEEMAAAVFEHADASHVIIKSAAVSDYKPGIISQHKMKKEKDEMTMPLIKNPDILSGLGKEKGSRFLVGFAAETEDLEKHATQKLFKKNLDIIVGNIVGSPDTGFGSDTNSVTLYYSDGTKEPIPMMDKEAVAHILLDRIRERIGE
jgi:phosphopantothenoylcysteine decarboxylase/phosphopantothenate--cysteine ligase